MKLKGGGLMERIKMGVKERWRVGVLELGMREKREEGGGKVWKLADRTGYAQTESRGPGPDLSRISNSEIPRPSFLHPPV